MTRSPLSPGSTIGILGGGQLGRMMSVAASQLGYHAHIYCPDADCPAGEVSKYSTAASYDDSAALKAFCEQVDVVTLEFENIPLEAAKTVEQYRTLHPSSDVLAICQHRLREKEFINQCGIATAPFKSATSLAEATHAIEAIGTPCILKTCTMGYDGKGQATVNTHPACGGGGAQRAEGGAASTPNPPQNKTDADTRKPPLPGATLPPSPPQAGGNIEQAWEQLASDDVIVEGFVPFEREASIIVTRNQTGDVVCYPLVENIHKHHILHQTIAPADVADAVKQQAKHIATTLAEKLDLVGIMAVELFICPGGELKVNELAPRPHNSGHWTMDACQINQFEQTIRAVVGLPLLPPHQHSTAVMTNLIGKDVNDWKTLAAEHNTSLHLYGKKETKPGRKMGHITRLTS